MDHSRDFTRLQPSGLNLMLSAYCIGDLIQVNKIHSHGREIFEILKRGCNVLIPRSPSDPTEWSISHGRWLPEAGDLPRSQGDRQ